MIPRVPVYRVGEGARWLARFLAPGSLIHMNRHIGGDHYTQGWGYPGLRYLKSKSDHEKMTESGAIGDPGVQDFFYFMRLQYVFLFALVLSFFAMFYFFREGDRLTPFVMTAYLGGSAHLLREQKYFYTDPLLIVIFVLGAFLLHAGTKNDRFSPYGRSLPLLAFWYVFAVSVKLSAVFLLAIPLAVIFSSGKHISEKISDLLKFCGYSALSFAAVHVSVIIGGGGALERFVQDNTANFWHYAVGHYRMEPAGWEHAKMILGVLEDEFGLLLYLFVPSFIASFVLSGRRGMIIKATLLLILAGTLYSLAQQRIHLIRNIIPLYPFLILLTSMGIWELYVKLRERTSPKSAGLALLSVLSLLAADRIHASLKTPWGFYRTFGDTRGAAVDYFRKIKRDKPGRSYSVGVDVGTDDRDHQTVGDAPLLSHDSFPGYMESGRRGSETGAPS